MKETEIAKKDKRPVVALTSGVRPKTISDSEQKGQGKTGLFSLDLFASLLLFGI